jgi:hypothetical protein
VRNESIFIGGFGLKRLSAILVCTVLIMTGLIGLAQLPGEVKGVTEFQSSFTLGPGNNDSMIIGIPSGAILTWSYTTADNFEFWAIGPAGVLDHQYLGTEGSTYSNGALVNTSGNYTFAWKNHEPSSATIDFTVRGFVPTGTTVSKLRSGEIINELNSTASGMVDTNASYLSFSLDNHTWIPVTIGSVDGSWSVDLNLSRGNNSLYFATTYSQGTFSYVKYQTFSIQTGFGLNFIPILQLTSPSSAISTLDLNQTVYGACDANATSVYVSLDNITFTQATKDSSNWKTGVTLSYGSDTIYMRADYQRGDFSYQYNDKTTINVDQIEPNPSDGNTQNVSQYDIGAILLIIAIFTIIVLVLGFVIIRRGKQGTA